MSRIGLTPCALVTLLGCASGGGYMAGDPIDAEVRRVLLSDAPGEMGIATAGVLYLVPPGQLGRERRALREALARAEAVPFLDPSALAPVPGHVGPTLAELRRSLPPPEEAIHALVTAEVIEIGHPDCTCRVVRFEPAGDSYRVDVDDRRFGTDRDLAYRMILRPSKEVDAAWAALVDAAERGAAFRHMVGPDTKPLETFRTLGVSRGPRAAN